LIRKIYGINPVAEALHSENLTVEKIFIREGRKDKKIKKIISTAKEKKAKVFFLDKNSFAKRFGDAFHQGIFAEISSFRYHSLDELLEYKKEKCFFLILDSIHDQQNFGNIIRSAEFLGVNAVIITKDKNAKVTETTVKISSGSVFHIPIVKEVNLSSVIHRLKENFFHIVSTSPDGSSNFPSFDKLEKVALIIGNEEKGIRSNLLKKSDYIIGIKRYGKTNSLNASASAAILIYTIGKALYGS
jgi:23S rRNA (guanosine2251-2'-O)-methyltransferase